VQPHVQPLASQELARPHLVEENEGAEDLPLRGREGASHLEAADIVGWWQDHAFHAGRHRLVGPFSPLILFILPTKRKWRRYPLATNRARPATSGARFRARGVKLCHQAARGCHGHDWVSNTG
jgi:hypothetical protein